MWPKLRSVAASPSVTVRTPSCHFIGRLSSLRPLRERMVGLTRSWGIRHSSVASVSPANSGDSYRDWLSVIHPGASQNVDLCGHFFRRAYSLIRTDGTFGLIATNSIRQGATREGTFLPILRDKGTIYRALRRLKWPGEAAVIVSVVHIIKGLSFTGRDLDGKKVNRIYAYLVEGKNDDSPTN